MFSIFRKKSYAVDLSILGADMHSHLLPGIDDGSQDTDTSIELIRVRKNRMVSPDLHFE